MAGVFDAAVATPTRDNGAANDHQLPAMNSLNLKAMTTATALAGTTGTDAKLIHGDRWQEIVGNLTENVSDDLTTHIFKNQTWTIDEDLKHKVSGKTTDTRVEDFKEYFLAETRSEYTLEHTEQHHDKDHVINPTHTFDILNVEGEYKNVDFAVKATVIEAKGIVTDVTVAKAEAWGAGAEAWAVGVGAGGFKNEAVGVDIGEKALKAEILETCGHMIAANAQVGMTRVIIMPVRVGICIAVHIDSPVA